MKFILNTKTPWRKGDKRGVEKCRYLCESTEETKHTIVYRVIDVIDRQDAMEGGFPATKGGIAKKFLPTFIESGRIEIVA